MNKIRQVYQLQRRLWDNEFSERFYMGGINRPYQIEGAAGEDGKGPSISSVLDSFM